MSESAVEVRGLCKSFGQVIALDQLDLMVPRGGVHGILGPNGAGKSTLLKILSTLIRPDAGELSVLGLDVIGHPAAIRSRISVTGQDTSLDDDLTGLENLVLIGRLRGLRTRQAKSRAEELIELAGLTDAGDRLVKDYSGGMRRRVDIVASLVVVPELLFLDEPTTGLDPESRNRVWEAVNGLVAEGVTLLLTTQNLDEADRLANRIVVVDRGRSVAEGSPSELKARIGGGVLQLTLSRPDLREEAARIISECVPAEIGGEDNKMEISVSGQDEATQVLQALGSGGVEIRDFALARPSLDEVFLSLTGHAPQSDLDGQSEENAPVTDGDDRGHQSEVTL